MKNNMMVGGLLCVALSAGNVLVGMKEKRQTLTNVSIVSRDTSDKKSVIATKKVRDEEYNQLVLDRNGSFSLLNHKCCNPKQLIKFNTADNFFDFYNKKKIIVFHLLKEHIVEKNLIVSMLNRAVDFAQCFKDRKEAFYLNLPDKTYLMESCKYYDENAQEWVSQKYAFHYLERINKGPHCAFSNKSKEYKIDPELLTIEYLENCFDDEACESDTQEVTARVIITSEQYEQLQNIKDLICIMVVNSDKQSSEWFTLLPKIEQEVKPEVEQKQDIQEVKQEVRVENGLGALPGFECYGSDEDSDDWNQGDEVEKLRNEWTTKNDAFKAECRDLKIEVDNRKPIGAMCLLQ